MKCFTLQGPSESHFAPWAFFQSPCRRVTFSLSCQQPFDTETPGHLPSRHPVRLEQLSLQIVRTFLSWQVLSAPPRLQIIIAMGGLSIQLYECIFPWTLETRHLWWLSGVMVGTLALIKPRRSFMIECFDYWELNFRHQNLYSRR